MNKNDIISMMKKFYKNNRITFPKDIVIEAKESGEKVKCIISLDSKHIREENMQKDYNAFEGWSIVVCAALRTEYKDVSVILDLKNNPNEKKVQIAKTFGCCRFVYNQTLAYRKDA